MKKRYGKWAFYKDRWVPIFAGGSTDDGNTRDREKRELNHDDGNSDLTRIQQEYERTLKFLQEKFGVSSIEELNLKLKKEEEEKLKRQEKFKELAEKKEKEALEYRQKWQQTILRAEVVGKASQMGFIDPDIVLSLVSPQAIVKDDGSVEINGKAIDEYLKELADAKPYLIKASNKQGSGATTTSQNITDTDIKSFEDLLKAGSQKIKEFIEKYPERYKQLKDEYFAKKTGG